ncbi:hypothetical protein HK105_207778 [Polyrhizophydium stewartii]|uniref:Uncharacterized protein n=1 Tax=Polyrhizophydium stewartii TaxID=2732419 RepID=A0ABR4MZF9_9FUNG
MHVRATLPLLGADKGPCEAAEMLIHLCTAAVLLCLPVALLPMLLEILGCILVMVVDWLDKIDNDAAREADSCNIKVQGVPGEDVSQRAKTACQSKQQVLPAAQARAKAVAILATLAAKKLAKSNKLDDSDVPSLFDESMDLVPADFSDFDDSDDDESEVDSTIVPVPGSVSVPSFSLSPKIHPTVDLVDKRDPSGAAAALTRAKAALATLAAKKLAKSNKLDASGVPSLFDESMDLVPADFGDFGDKSQTDSTSVPVPGRVPVPSLSLSPKPGIMAKHETLRHGVSNAVGNEPDAAALAHASCESLFDIDLDKVMVPSEADTSGLPAFIAAPEVRETTSVARRNAIDARKPERTMIPAIKIGSKDSPTAGGAKIGSPAAPLTTNRKAAVPKAASALPREAASVLAAALSADTDKSDCNVIGAQIETSEPGRPRKTSDRAACDKVERQTPDDVNLTLGYLSQAIKLVEVAFDAKEADKRAAPPRTDLSRKPALETAKDDTLHDCRKLIVGRLAMLCVTLLNDPARPCMPSIDKNEPHLGRTKLASQTHAVEEHLDKQAPASSLRWETLEACRTWPRGMPRLILNGHPFVGRHCSICLTPVGAFSPVGHRIAVCSDPHIQACRDAVGFTSPLTPTYSHILTSEGGSLLNASIADASASCRFDKIDRMHPCNIDAVRDSLRCRGSVRILPSYSRILISRTPAASHHTSRKPQHTISTQTNKMSKLASQLVRAMACRTAREACDQAAAQAQHAAERRQVKIRTIADVAVEAAAKDLSPKALASVDLAVVKRDAADRAEAAMATNRKAAERAAADEIAVAEASAARAMSAGLEDAGNSKFATELIAAVVEACGKTRAASINQINEPTIIEHAKAALVAAVREAERAAAAQAAATNIERMTRDKEPHPTSNKAAAAIPVENLTGNCDASSSTTEDAAAAMSKNEDESQKKRGKKNKKNKKAKKAKKGDRGTNSHWQADSAETAAKATRSTSEAVANEAPDSKAAPRGAEAAQVLPKTDSAVCLDKAVEAAEQSLVKEADTAVVAPQINELVAMATASDTDRNKTDAASIVTASLMAGASSACAPPAGGLHGSSSPVSNSNDTIKATAVMRTVAPAGRTAASTSTQRSKAFSSSSAGSLRSVDLSVAPGVSRFATATAPRTTTEPSSTSQPSTTTAVTAPSARPPLAPARNATQLPSPDAARADPHTSNRPPASSFFQSSPEAQRAAARYSRYLASLPDSGRNSGINTAKRGCASAARPASRELDHISMISKMHSLATAGFAWSDLQISDDDWHGIVAKFNGRVTKEDLVQLHGAE